MRNVLLCIALMFAGQSGSQVETPAVIISSINLSQEQVDVYRGFLSDYMAGPPATIHVADVTSTFAPDAGDFAGCMKRFSSTKPITEVHSLKNVFAGNKSVILVDASKHTIQDPEDAMRQGTGVNEAVNKGLGAGLMTLSEIMIDPSHTQAAFSYSFHCGRLCGYGGTVGYHKEGRKWIRSKQQCGNWIS